MKALTIGLLVFAGCCIALSPAAAESVIVTEPWVKVRAEPAPGTKAIGLAYGNDRYELLDTVEGWYRIVTSNGKEGWIPTETAYEVIGPIARKSFAVAEGMRTTGRSRRARSEFFQVMQHFQGTVQGYEATRHLLSYYPVGDLPPLEEGRIPPGANLEAERVKPFLFIEEGRVLLEEGRYTEARAMFEQARVSGVVNFSAMDGIRETLQREMQIALEEGDPEQIQVVQIALKGYFPEVWSRSRFRWIDPATGRRVGAPPPKDPPGTWTPPGDPMLDESGDGGPALNAGDAMDMMDKADDDSSPAQLPPDSGAAGMAPMGDDAMDGGIDEDPMDGDAETMMDDDGGMAPLDEDMPANDMQDTPVPGSPEGMENGPPDNGNEPMMDDEAAGDESSAQAAGQTAGAHSPAVASANPALPPAPVTLDQLNERPTTQAPQP